MKNRPTKFRYGSFDFEILYKHNLIDTVGSMGETYFNNLEIWMDTNMKPAIEKETLLHELLHVVLRDIGAFSNSDQEEQFIRLLSPRLAQLFTDNKQLGEFIFDVGVKKNEKRK